MKRLFLCFLCVAFVLTVRSQSIEGATGLMKIPTAEMRADGTFIAGMNYLPDEITPHHYFNYDTYNYFVNLTFLPFLEFSYRVTAMKLEGVNNQDRSFGLRCMLLRQRNFLPSIVIGGNDLFNSSQVLNLSGNFEKSNNNFYYSLYVVATKTIDLNDQIVDISFGIGSGGQQEHNLDGIFGGVSFRPSVLPNLKLMAEYDSKVFNAGAEILLLKHLYVFGMAYDLQVFAGGLSFRLDLKN